MSFFSEFKRRKMIRVAVAYGAGALTLATAANLIETGLQEDFFWLEGLQGVTIILLIVGFPVVMLISWFFNWTPQGFVRDTGDPALADGADRGQTLDELIATGRMSTSRLMRLAVQMSDHLMN